MLVEVFAAFTQSIKVHPGFSKDFHLFGGQIPQFRLHFIIPDHRLLLKADTPKTGRFSRFASFEAHSRSPTALLCFQLYHSIRIDFTDFVTRKSYLN